MWTALNPTMSDHRRWKRPVSSRKKGDGDRRIEASAFDSGSRCGDCLHDASLGVAETGRQRTDTVDLNCPRSATKDQRDATLVTVDRSHGWQSSRLGCWFAPDTIAKGERPDASEENRIVL